MKLNLNKTFLALTRMSGLRIPVRFRAKYFGAGTGVSREGTFAFPVLGQEVVVLQHAHTFIWLNPLTKLYHVCEMKTGAFIVADGFPEMAVTKARSILSKVKGDELLAHWAKMGDALERDQVSPEEALGASLGVAIASGVVTKK